MYIHLQYFTNARKCSQISAKQAIFKPVMSTILHIFIYTSNRLHLCLFVTILSMIVTISTPFDTILTPIGYNLGCNQLQIGVLAITKCIWYTVGVAYRATEQSTGLIRPRCSLSRQRDRDGSPIREPWTLTIEYPVRQPDTPARVRGSLFPGSVH